MKTLITIIGISLSSCLFAQPSFEWGQAFGDDFNDQSTEICHDNSGNTYVIGQFNGTVDFDPGIGVSNLISGGQPNGFIQKLDPTGNLVWVQGFIGSGTCNPQSISINSSGNILISGDFSSTIDFDPNAGNDSRTATATKDIFILTLDDLGALNWVSTINAGSPIMFNQGDGVPHRIESKFDSNDNICIAGTFIGTVDFDPGATVYSITASSSVREAFVMKLNSSGSFLWAHAFGNASGYSFGYCIEIGLNDEIIVGGIFYDGTIDFDPGSGVFNLTASGAQDSWLLKLNSSGDFIWAKMMVNISGNNYGDAIRDVVINNAGDIYATGHFSGSTDFDPSTGDFITSTSLVGSYILKLNDTGDFLWVRTLEGLGFAFGHSISLDPSENVYSVGPFDGTIDLDPSVGVDNVTSGGSQDVYISKIDPTGNYMWGGRIGGGSNCTRPHITVNNLHDIIVTGNFANSIDLDPSSAVYNVNSSGVWGIFTVKLSQCVPTSPVPDLSTLIVLNDECSISIPSAPTASNCTGTFIGVPDQSFPISTQGLTLITWTYDDGNGNTSTQTQDVVINDVSAPIADVGSLTTLTAQCEITSLTAPTATDNCVGSVSGTTTTTLPITASTTITWTYDDGNGNTSTQTQDVVINDVSAPIADAGSLTTLTAQCEITSLTAPTATDNCVGSVTGTTTTALPITASTTITWTYDDGNGNTSTQTQDVVINDAIAPVADVASLTNIISECEVTPTAPTATDNCVGAITGTPDVSFPITATGTTTITWTYDDGNGNTSTQTQEVIIDDVTAPVADLANLADINSECEVTPAAPTATDNCTGAVTGTPDISFPITATGTTTVTWTYNDGNGNTSTQTQDVIITPIDNSVSVVDAITLSADASGYTYQWVDCNDNNEPIAGETAQTIEAIANGSYAVIIDNGDCSVTSSCFDITTVGLDKNEIQTINVFPNPTSGMVTINSSTQFITVEVVNLMGQVVYATTLNEVSTHQVKLPEAKGVYLIKVSGNTTNDTFRIIKK